MRDKSPIEIIIEEDDREKFMTEQTAELRGEVFECKHCDRSYHLSQSTGSGMCERCFRDGPPTLDMDRNTKNWIGAWRK